MKGALSPAAQKAVTLAVVHGGSLVRLPGGFWTYPGCPVESRPWGDVPTDYVQTSTVQALVRRGVFVETEHRTSRTTTGAASSFAVKVSMRDS